MSHSFYMTKSFTFLPLFHNSNNHGSEFLYVATFYTDKCFYEKSTFILHLQSNDYISGLVYSLNIRQYVSIIVLTLQQRRTFKFLHSPRTEEFKFPTSSAPSSIQGIDLRFLTSLDAIRSIEPCMGVFILL
jgi:hypothetical protein